MIEMPKGSRRSHHNSRESGAVAIEFALLMAFLPLMVLAFGIVDYGEFMAQWTDLAAITRGAAEYARGEVVQSNPLPSPADLQNLLGVPASVFSTSSFCTCADKTSVPCPGRGDPNPCAAKADGRVVTYVAVDGLQTCTPLVSGSWSFPPSVYARTVLRTQ